MKLKLWIKTSTSLYWSLVGFYSLDRLLTWQATFPDANFRVANFSPKT